MLPVLSCLQRQTFPDSSQGHRLWSKICLLFLTKTIQKVVVYFKIIYIEKRWIERKTQDITKPCSFISSTVYVCVYLSACLLLSPITGKTTDLCNFVTGFSEGTSSVKQAQKRNLSRLNGERLEWVLDIHLCISFSMIILFTPKPHTFIYI